jgi:hypothetical protein
MGAVEIWMVVVMGVALVATLWVVEESVRHRVSGQHFERDVRSYHEPRVVRRPPRARAAAHLRVVTVDVYRSRGPRPAA